MIRTVLPLLFALALIGAERPLTIVCFGDSITGNRPRESYHQHYVKYSDLLQLLIEGRSGLGTCTVINAGYAGDATDRRGDRPGAVNRLAQDVIAGQPDIAVILIGGNDAKGFAREVTAENFDRMFAACIAAGIRVLAVQYVVVAEATHPTAWHHLDDNNDLIAAAAAAHGIPVYDPQPAFMAAAADHGGTATLVDDRDRVHLRPGGELVLARGLFARLHDLGWLDR